MEIAAIVLAGMLVGSNIFWLFTVHKLLNKLMSRNYFEYNQAERVGERAPRDNSAEEAIISQHEKRRVQDLNQIMGMV